MSYYREQLENFLKTVDVDADAVIDLGGKQKPIKDRTKTWKVKNYYILDLPEHNIEENITFEHKSDLLFCLEVFEYIINPLAAFKNIKKLMKENSLAYVSFPFIYPLHNEVELDSLRYTLSGIKRLSASSGLTILDVVYRKAKNDGLTKYYADDGMRAAKGMSHNITGYIVKFKN